MTELAEFLGHILEQNGIENYLEWVSDINEAINEKRFEWFYRNEKCVGFYTWVEKWKDGKQYIYVGNLFIEPQSRAVNNIYKIKSYLRNKFPNAEKAYWINTKSKEFVYD